MVVALGVKTNSNKGLEKGADVVVALEGDTIECVLAAMSS